MRDAAPDPTGRSIPDVTADWMAAMRDGDWSRAWSLSDRVLAARTPSDFDRPWTPYHMRCVWDGRPLAGRRVLIRCYHGLGDTIQFIRFGPELRQRSCRVLVEAQPELLPLLRRCGWIETLVPLGGADGLTHFVSIESMEIAHALRVLPATVPAAVPYLDAGEAPSGLPADKRPRVGLVWRAGDWDPRRSLDLAALAPLLTVDGIAFVSLQRGTWAGELERFVIADGATAEITGLAASLRDLDLVVTVDTMVAHLAGALGRPVWTLLHAQADWRWGYGTATPWYPTMRLYRQSRPGDWEAAVAAMAADLAHWPGRQTDRWRSGNVPGP